MLTVSTLGWGLSALARPGGGLGCPQSTGPDVVVGDIWDIWNYPAAGGMDVVSVGTYSCNVGSAELRWWAFQNQHPVIGQSLYTRRKVNGTWRFEQIGQSWLKHGFYADNDQQPSFCCATCTPSTTGNPGEYLGIGCSDPYNAPRNGQQFNLGPKSEVNPHTGTYPFDNWNNFPTHPPYSGNGRRLQVALGDLAPTSTSVEFYAEAQYVTPDDATAGNQNNNASYRPLSVSGGPGDFTFALAGATVEGKPALRAWKDVDPSVLAVDVQVPNDGLFIVACQVTNLLNGWWHYEYAVQNLNADRGGNSFSIPVPGCTQVQNIGFHDVAYLDGDGYHTSNSVASNYDGTDWAAVRSGGALTWSTASFASNPNANALRWGTTYNFRFDANAAPVGANVTLGLYKRGTPGSMLVTLQGPGGSNPPSCPADVADSNHVVNVNDLLSVITHWGTSGPGDCSPACGDGTVNVNDLLAVITAWGPCPP